MAINSLKKLCVKVGFDDKKSWSNKNYVALKHINMHIEITSVIFYSFPVEKYEIARKRLKLDLICTNTD